MTILIEARIHAVIEYKVHFRTFFLQVEKSHSAQLSVEDMAGESGLERILVSPQIVYKICGMQTSTTLVRSRQSMQLTRKAPFCWDMMWSLDIQKYLSHCQLRILVVRLRTVPTLGSQMCVLACR